MSTKLIGAVAIKVKPDTSGFRREADKGLDRETRGLDREIDVKANVTADTRKAQRQLDDLKRKAQEALNVDIELDDKASGRFAEYAQAARRQMRELQNEQRKLQSDVDNGMATNWAKRSGELKKFTQATKASFREIADASKRARIEDQFLGFEGVQGTIDKIVGAQQKMSTMSASIWDDAAKAGERYADAVARMHDAEASAPAGSWNDQTGAGMRAGLAKNVEALDKQLTKLQETDKRLSGLSARWNSLGDAQKKAVASLSTAEDNAGMAREEEKLRVFKEQLTALGAAQVAKRKAEKLSAEELLAVEEELARRIESRKLAQRFEGAPTITGEGMNLRADQSYAEEAKFAKWRVSLQERTAHQLRRLEEGTQALARAARGRDEDELRRHNKEIVAIGEETQRRLEELRIKASFNLSAKQARDNARIEAENRRHLEQMALDNTNDLESRSKQDFYSSMFDNSAQLEKARKVALDMLKGIQGSKFQFSEITVGLDKDSVEKVKRDAERLRETLDNMEAHIAVNPTGLQLAAARLAWLTRPRTVNIIAKVNGKALAMAEGALRALSGINVAQDIGRKFEKAFKEIDTWALKIGKLGTVIGGVAGGLGALTANIFSIGAGVAESIGLMALLPTAALTAFTGFSVFSMAFNNFSNAFSDIPIVAEQAMKDLPPLAKKAVKELAGSWKGISDPVQEAFWGVMGDAVGQMKRRILPPLKEGFVSVAPHAAKFTKGVLDSFVKLADSGDMKRLFTNISRMFDNASGAATPFFDAFNTFGLRGSRFLPQFGTWLTNISTQFNNWVQTADKAGDIDRWIRQGIQSLKDMVKVGGATVDIFKAISRAALNAGGANLTQFADGMRDLADSMLAPVFQSNMSNLFSGAIKGAGHMMTGMKDLGRVIGDTSGFWEKFLEIAGQVAGLSFTNISKSLESVRLQEGVIVGFEGLRDMVKDLGPTFRSVGDIIGDLGIIAGGVFDGMAPIINGISDAIAGVTGKLADNAAELSPLLTGQLAGTIQGLGTVIGGISTIVSGVIGWFLSWDEGIQKVVISLGAFALLRGSISKTITALTNIGPLSRMKDEYRATAILAGKSADEIKKVGGATMVLGAAGARVKDYGDKLKGAEGATGKLKTVSGGLYNLLGGGWGIAIGAAVTLLGLYSQEQGRAEEHVRQLADSLDQQTGSFTASSDVIIAKNLEVKESFLGAWKNGQFFRDDSAFDIAEKYGVPLDKLVDAAKGVPGAMDDVNRALSESGADDQSFSWAKVGTDFLKSLVGVNAGELMETDADKVRSALEKQGGAIDKAKEKIERLAKATGTSAPNAQKLSKAFDIVGDSASSAADLVGALKTQLDILKDGALSAKDAARHFAKEWEGAIDELKELGKADTGLDKLVDAKGNIEDLSGSGGKLYDVAKNVSDAILLKSTSAYKAVIDGKGSIAEAEAAAAQALVLSEKQIKQFADSVGIDVGKAEALLQSFFGEDWEMMAMMGINSEAFFAERKRATDAGEEFGEKEWRAYLGANSEGFEEAKAAAEAAGVEFSSETYLAFLEANPDPAKRSVDNAVAWARGYAENSYHAVLEAANDEAKASIADAASKAGEFTNGEYKAWLEALDKTDPGTAMAIQSIMEMTGQDYAAVIKALNEAKPGSAEAEATILAMTVKDYNATIKALDKTGDGVAKSSEAIRSMTSKEYAAWIKSLDKTDPGLATSVRSIRDMTDDEYSALIKAVDGTKPGKDAAQRNIDSTKGTTSDIKASNQTKPGKDSAQKMINSTTGRTASIWAADMARAGKDRAQRTINGILGKTASIFAANKTQPGKDSVTRSLGSLAFTAAVKGSYGGWKKWPAIAALTVSVWGAFRGTKGAPGSADGSIWDGKSNPLTGKFPMKMQPFKAFANGGIESHVAQIAGPSSNSIRIWAEPETGGEAYIPLAASKRSRSLEIWKETGRRLNAYADGGIEGGAAASGVTQTFNITNHNPVAEKNSVAVNRALQFASVPGL